MVKSLKGQLAELGYSPSDITYLALSHYHYDHTANANEFAGATWLVREVERDAMFAEKAPGTTQPSTYSDLRHSKTLAGSPEGHQRLPMSLMQSARASHAVAGRTIYIGGNHPTVER
jgi:glyoxylase-like metal-dependent hydrolase (beta-lactamase superfamily II)